MKSFSTPIFTAVSKKYYAEAGLMLAFLFGLVIRVWRINDLPFPPNDSELFFGYYGWSLLHFGIDEFGARWPMNFPSIGDFKYPGLAYLNIIPAAIFGLSLITVRFWSVLTGIILIPVIYLFSLMIFKNKPAALASAWLLAFSPWSIVLSRIGYENHVAVAFSVTGLLLFLLPFIKINNLGFLYTKISEYAAKNKNKLLVASFVLLFIASFSYAAQRIFIPLIFLFLFLLSLKKGSELFKAKKAILYFFVILTSIIIVSLIPWQNRGRYLSLIYSKPTSQEVSRQEEIIHESGLSPIRTPVILTRIFHNKYRIIAYHLLEKYVFQFSPDFLFFNGDASYERVPDSGQLLLVEIILLPLGFAVMFKRRFLPLSMIVLFSLLFAPLSSSLTTGSSINRASLMIPFLSLISGLGLGYIVSISKYKPRIILLTFLITMFSFSVGYSLYQIFVIKPIHHAWYSEVVNQKMVEEVLRIKGEYKGVVIPKDEYIFFLFYGKISPREFLSDSDIKPLDRLNPWDRVVRYSNIHFNMPFNCPASGKENVLYICTGENIPQNSRVLKVFRYRDGVPAYTFVTFYPISQISNPLPELPDRLKYMVDLESDPKKPDGMIDSDSLEWW